MKPTILSAQTWTVNKKHGNAKERGINIQHNLKISRPQLGKLGSEKSRGALINLSPSEQLIPHSSRAKGEDNDISETNCPLTANWDGHSLDRCGWLAYFLFLYRQVQACTNLTL